MINKVVKSRRGFTLIELIATIALLAIISAISVVSINHVITESKVSDCGSLFKNIEIATKNYVSDNRYGNIIGGTLEITAKDLIDNQYLSDPLVNPFTGNEINANKIRININLNKDFSVDSVIIMTSSHTELTCDNKDLFKDVEKKDDDGEDDYSPELLKVDIPDEKYCISDAEYNGNTVFFVQAKSDYYTFNNTGGVTPGNYTVTVSLKNSNYVWSDGTTSNKTFVCNIKKKNVTITAKSQETDASGNIATDVSQITTAGLISGHVVTSVSLNVSGLVGLEGTITPSNAVIMNGNTDVTSNYNITYNTGIVKRSAIVATIGNCNTLTYNGSSQTLVSGGTGVTYSNNKGTNAGTYSVTVNADSGYVFEDGSTTTKLTCSILKAAGSISYETTTVSKTYGDAVFTNTLTKTGDGTVTYSSSDTSVAKVNSSTGAVTIVEAGGTTITATVKDGTNYTYATKTATYTLNVVKAPNSVSLTCATLTYTGSAQTLISSASTTSETIYYKVGTALTGSNYNTTGSTAKPTGTNAGDYVIYYYVPASLNYYEVSGNKTCSISKAAGSISYGTTTVSKTYGDAAFTNTLTKTGDGTVTYSSSNTGVATVNSSTGAVTIVGAGSATITATVADGTNYTYATKTATYTVSVAKKTNPLTVTAVGGEYSGTPVALASASNAQGTVYYKVGTALTSSNYNTTGSTTIPTGTCTSTSGNSYTVYYYTPGNTNYAAKSGSVTAKVTCKTYTVSYNANGGSGAPSSQTKYYGITLTLSSTEPTRDGYTFRGWSTNKDATDATYGAGGYYTGNNDITLYAVWLMAPHTHQWDAGGITRVDFSYSLGYFSCGYEHTSSFMLYCSICGMSGGYYNEHKSSNQTGVATMWCPDASYPPTYFDDTVLFKNDAKFPLVINAGWTSTKEALSAVASWGGATVPGSYRFEEATYNDRQLKYEKHY